MVTRTRLISNNTDIACLIVCCVGERKSSKLGTNYLIAFLALFCQRTVRMHTILDCDILGYQIYTKCVCVKNSPSVILSIVHVYILSIWHRCLFPQMGSHMKAWYYQPLSEHSKLESYVFCTFITLVSPISVILYLIGTKLFNAQSTLWFPIFELIFEIRNSFCWTVPNRTSASMSNIDVNI